MQLTDRLDPDSFSNDEVVGVAAVERDVPMQDVPEADWIFVPERLFHRLLSLGEAYSLHFAPLLESQADSELNATQCQGFLDELRFLHQVVADAALSAMLKELLPKVEHVVRHSGLSLRFSPP